MFKTSQMLDDHAASLRSGWGLHLIHSTRDRVSSALNGVPRGQRSKYKPSGTAIGFQGDRTELDHQIAERKARRALRWIVSRGTETPPAHIAEAVSMFKNEIEKRTQEKLSQR